MVGFYVPLKSLLCIKLKCDRNKMTSLICSIAITIIIAKWNLLGPTEMLFVKRV